MLSLLNDSSQFGTREGSTKTITHEKYGASKAPAPHAEVTLAKAKRGGVWTAANIAILRQHGSSKSATQIAAMIGQGVKRGAVIGKMRRMGISLTGDGVKRQLKALSPKPPKKPIRAVSIPAAPIPAQAISASAQPPLLVSLTHLKPRECHWPIGDPLVPGFGFCGHPSDPAKPYCPAHMKLAYRPTVMVAK